MDDYKWHAACITGVPPISDETRGEAASRRKQQFSDTKKTEDTGAELQIVQLPGQGRVSGQC